MVFAFLDAFEPDRMALEELKMQYREGGLANSLLKRRLNEHLQALLEPIRQRRRQFAGDRGEVMSVLRQGTEKARQVASQTVLEVKAALGLKYFS